MTKLFHVTVGKKIFHVNVQDKKLVIDFLKMLEKNQ